MNIPLNLKQTSYLCRSVQPQFARVTPPSQKLLRCSTLKIKAENRPTEKQEFGYSRKDILLLGGGIIAFAYGLYYGAQALGVDAATAGNYVQIGIFSIISVGYVATYVLRVATKNMTYTQQLKKYEEDVMQKRSEEHV
eukprot:TRINITY_DN576_c0_g1_i1.p1 TRINITY_DN576_c0_g1~~TRINITY_DN576_c0_g1_i1.p1  ORF type:complete len:138 (-),score=11.38 TRINITY_DN576_c0_g1_i1:70-483(-)